RREQEDADVRRVLHILAAVDRSVPQRGHASTIPVLGCRVDQKHLRFESGRNLRSQTIFSSGDRVGRGLVQDRKLRLRERAELVWLRKAVGEAAERRSAAG